MCCMPTGRGRALYSCTDALVVSTRRICLTPQCHRAPFHPHTLYELFRATVHADRGAALAPVFWRGASGASLARIDVSEEGGHHSK